MYLKVLKLKGLGRPHWKSPLQNANPCKYMCENFPWKLEWSCWKYISKPVFINSLYIQCNWLDYLFWISPVTNQSARLLQSLKVKIAPYLYTNFSREIIERHVKNFKFNLNFHFFCQIASAQLVVAYVCVWIGHSAQVLKADFCTQIWNMPGSGGVLRF